MVSNENINRKLLLAGWALLALFGCLLIVSFETLAPRFYRNEKNKVLMQAYRDVEELDFSDLDEDACEVFTEYESKSLLFFVSDETHEQIYMSRTSGEWEQRKSTDNWKEMYSEEPKIFFQQDNMLRLARLRGIVRQGSARYYVYIKERGINVSDYNRIVTPFLVLLAVVWLLVCGALFLLCWRRLGAQYEREASLSKDAQMQQKLRSARVERLQKDFAARMTHELKTPLAVISSQVEMLEYVTEPGQQKPYIDSVREEVERISGMVGNMLDVSVVEHQMEHMLQNTLDMREIMEYVAMKYEGIISKKKVRLETFFDDGCTVRGDREYIEQALNNFMMNALEHTPMEGSVRMTLKKKRDVVRAAVYNEGSQIPKKEQERLWDGYYRKERETTMDSSMPHAGLGLSIARTAVWMHGGVCGMKNMEQGVEFWFELPKGA